MKTFEIILNGESYGDIVAQDEEHAIKAHVLDAGYTSIESMLDVTGQTKDAYMSTVQVVEIRNPEEVASEIVRLVIGFADVDAINGDKGRFWITASDDDHVYDIEVVRADREITSEMNIYLEIKIDGVAYKANANDRLRDIAA